MKKLLNVLILTLALNFLVVAGVVGWLYKSHRIDREKMQAIKEIVFPATQPSSAATQPAETEEVATTQPMMKLEELLAKQAGRSTSDQVEFIQHTFDAQMAMLDRRNRELNGLLDQVNQAKAKLSRDRESLSQEQSALQGREQLAAQLENDKGFQDCLALYNSMPSKQVKTIFMTLDEPTVTRYLQAMQPRSAARIVKEFKAPEEVERIQKVLERMRQSQQPSVPAAPSSPPPTPSSAAANAPANAANLAANTKGP
jgi:hypothetical protein